MLLQPTEGVETKPKLRKPPPPKQEVQTGGFQGIQLKPVAKALQKPEQAENGTVGLKVARKYGTFEKILLRILFSLSVSFFSVSFLSLCHLFLFLSISTKISTDFNSIREIIKSLASSSVSYFSATLNYKFLQFLIFRYFYNVF